MFFRLRTLSVFALCVETRKRVRGGVGSMKINCSTNAEELPRQTQTHIHVMSQLTNHNINNCHRAQRSTSRSDAMRKVCVVQQQQSSAPLFTTQLI